MIANVRGIEIVYSQQNEFWELVSRNEWEPFTFDCIDKYCTPGSVFIDIGAWNGVFSVYARKKGIKVYAVEPDQAATNLFTGLLDSNGVSVFFFKGAISDNSGMQLLNYDIQGNSESSLVRSGKYGYSVPVKTMFDFMLPILHQNDSIGLIKMDIEGAEINVLPQAREWIMQHKPNMHISFHPSYIESYDVVMYLFDVYDAVSDNGTVVTADNFREVLDSHSHAFMFTAK